MAEDLPESSIFRVLIAGGREAVQAFDETGLPGDDVEVFVAGNGAGAMCELMSNRYDLALIDHSVERVDGLRLTVVIRSTPAVSDIPIVLIVEADDVLSRLEGHRVGADKVLVKPVDAVKIGTAFEDLFGIGEAPGA